MTTLDWIIAVPWFGGGLLVWPIAKLFFRKLEGPSHWLRRVFFCTFAALTALGGLLVTVALLGRFNHNWLPLTLLFPLINLASVCLSIVGALGRSKRVS